MCMLTAVCVAVENAGDTDGVGDTDVGVTDSVYNSVFLCFLQDPKERLGCQPQTGFSDIKSHTFFRSIDWDLVKIITSVCAFKRNLVSFLLI